MLHVEFFCVTWTIGMPIKRTMFTVRKATRWIRHLVWLKISLKIEFILQGEWVLGVKHQAFYLRCLHIYTIWRHLNTSIMTPSQCINLSDKSISASFLFLKNSHMTGIRDLGTSKTRKKCPNQLWSIMFSKKIFEFDKKYTHVLWNYIHLIFISCINP